MSGSPLALGIDIGGSTTKFGIVSSRGQILATRRIPSHLGVDTVHAYLDTVFDVTRALLGEAPGEVTAIGVSLIGGIADDESGTLCAVNGPGLQGLDLRSRFEASFGLPVRITNDLTAHTLAEYWFGVGAGSMRFLCLALGTGLGAGVVIDGEPVMLWGGTAGDTGRIILDPDSSVKCDGRARGSAEALCGVAGIERLAQERHGRPVTCPEVIRAAQAGTDPISSGIIGEVGKRLGHLLAILSVIFFPTHIALTGGIAEAGTSLLDPCVAEFNSLVGDYFDLLAGSSPGFCTRAQISKGLLGADAGMIGAAARALRGCGTAAAGSR